MIEYYTIVVDRINVLKDSLHSCGQPSKCAHSGGLDVQPRFFNQRVSRKSILISAIGLIVCFCFLSSVALPTFAQGSIDEGRQALKNKVYPWYDADTDGTRAMEMGERPAARSANRNEIPLKKLKPKSKKAYTPPTGGGGGGPVKLGDSWLNGLTALTWAVVILLVAVVAGVLIWAMLRMSSIEAPQEDEDVAPKRSMSESIKHLPFKLDSPTGDFRQHSQAAYAEGDYRMAITYLFSHVLVTLDQKGLIRLRKGKTNRQYLNELRPHRPLANYYQHVMVPFEASFFGDHDLSKSGFDACWNQLDSFLTEVDQASRTAVTSQSGHRTQVANA